MAGQRRGRQPSSRRQRRAAASDTGRQRGAGRRVVETHDLPDLQKARGHWQAKRFPQALDLFERVVRKHPRNLLALTDAARAFGARYEIEKAQAYLERMLELAPDDAAVQLLAGQSYRMIYRPARAIACLERAVALQPDLLDARLELAMLLERRGRLDEALAQLAGFGGEAGCPPEVHVVEGRLRRRLKEPARAIELLRGVVDDGQAFWATRLQAGMELARVHDGAGDFDAAVDAAAQAKALARASMGEPVTPQDTWISRKWVESNHQADAGRIAGWAEQLKDCPPKNVALLTGPPRSGTTLLENILDAHAGLISSDERDAFPRYITGAMLMGGEGDEPALDVLDRQTPERLNEMRKRYLGFVESALGEPIGDRLHLDKNPSISTLIPGVLRLFPECKVLMALRDPRDVVLSCYLTHMPINSQSVPYLDFKSAAEHYADTMRAWLALREHLTPEQYLEVRYEDVVADTEGQARRGLAFLGLPWDDAVLAFHEHAARKQVDSPTYEQVARPIYTSSMGRWRHYEKHMAEALEVLQPMIETLGYA